MSSILHYNEPLFRPPSEAASLIFQLTLGCSWNKCAFCEMYSSKKFRTRDLSVVLKEIEQAGQYYQSIKKIFLADGDAFVLPTKKLLKVLLKIKKTFPKVKRVSAYALPSNILKKSSYELTELQQAGLKLIYLGIESGDDTILKKIKKGETKLSTIEGLVKAGDAGIKRSVMILNGLGGAAYSKSHAKNSADVLNHTQVEYASTLVLYFPLGQSRFIESFGNDYIALDQMGLIREMKYLLENTNLKSTIFRSDHASNYLVLKGVLGRDKEKLIKSIEDVLQAKDSKGLRPEWMRGL